MNLTYQRYESIEGVYPLQMYFEKWPSDAFSDRNHLDADGREIFCKRVTPIVDAIHYGENVSDVVIDPRVYEITDPRGECFSPNFILNFEVEILKFESENYSSCTYGEDYVGTTWEFQTIFSNYSGQGYMVAVPDSKIKTGDSIDGPELSYNITNLSSRNYSLWIRMAAPDGGGDSIHIGLDGIPITYGGVGFSTSPNNQWNWEEISINPTSNDYTILNIWMREDGVKVDSFIITSDFEFIPS